MKSLFIKKTVATDTKTDYDRPLFDLANDVRQKRKLIEMLLRDNKRLKTTFKLTAFLIILLTSISILYTFGNDFHSKTFDKYYKEFRDRYIYGLGFSSITEFEEASKFVDEYKVNLESKMLRSLLSINKKDFSKALFLLSEIDSQEARWLEALCYVKTKNDIKAKKALKEIIVDKNNLFYPDAKEIIEEHYNRDKNYSK
jgi:hypothetical protein